MSRLNLIDYILKPEDNEVTTMDDMNTALDDSSDFMRSDFFDSVMSLEEDNHNGNVLENNYLKMECVPPPSSETSSHFDEVQSNNSLSLDSDKWNEIFETSPTINLPEDTFFPFVEEPRTVLKTERPTQNQSQNKILLDKVKGKKLYVTKINPSKILHNKPGSREKQMIKIVDFKKNYTNKQVLRVQSLTGNGQPLLLPISDVKRIKIVNASEIKTEGLTIKKHQPVQFKKQKTETYSVSSSDCTEDDIDMSETSPYPALVLTTEEKRLLDKDGIQLPTHYPLTKNEERELKRIRRKIRNKISAQDSRKRKKEYVDGLEERVKRGSEENKFLLKRVKQLQKQNSRLMAQMSKLQSILFNTSASKVTPSTCLMIVLFSALLVSLPNLHTSNEKELGDIQQMAARRALLFSQQATNEEDTLNMEEFLLFNKEDDVDNYIEEGADENETSTEKEAFTKFISEAEKKFNNEPNRSELNSFDSFIELFSKFENKIKNLFGTLNSGYLANDKQEYGGTITKNGFMEPDIDDDLPKNNKNIKNDYLEEGTPPKRMKFNTLDPDINEKHDFNDNVVSATLNSAYKISESKKQ